METAVIERKFHNRDYERQVEEVVQEFVDGTDLEWESIPRVWACKACRKPLVITNHAYHVSSPQNILFNMRLYKIAGKVGALYVPMTFSKRHVVVWKPPYSFSGRQVYTYKQFFSEGMVELLGETCPACGNKHQPKVKIDPPDVVLPPDGVENFYLDPIFLEDLFRYHSPSIVTAIDIDFVLFKVSEDDPACLIEGDVTKYLNSFKATSITERLAEELNIPAFHIRIVKGWGTFIRELPKGLWVKFSKVWLLSRL